MSVSPGCLAFQICFLDFPGVKCSGFPSGILPGSRRICVCSGLLFLAGYGGLDRADTDMARILFIEVDLVARWFFFFNSFHA